MKNWKVWTPAAVLSLLCATSAHAADWSGWWLPTNHSQHGGDIDTLFNVIFWLTMIVWIIVTAVMFTFLVKYRYRPGRKALFTHGNTRLEMIWTIAPAIILLLLAMWSKRVWDNYRYSTDGDNGKAVEYVVIGQQFQWNFIYAGPDGKVGKYLNFPKPSDAKWPGIYDPATGKTKEVVFNNVPGPAYLPYPQAVQAINNYMEQENPLGKDLADPAGADDDWSKTPGRPQFIPVDRPIKIWLSSKDVIHDYFLPNFRVKLDAVPGMRGEIDYHPLPGCESVKSYKIDDPELVGKAIWIDPDDKGAQYDHRTNDYRIPDPKKPKTTSIIRNLATANESAIARLKAAGVTEIRAYVPYELVCEELCGQGHYKMRGELVVLPQKAFDYFIHKGHEPTTQPARAIASANSSLMPVMAQVAK
jgi:heme/copper-type cytochrome/quinol oxidase subunit 2